MLGRGTCDWLAILRLTLICVVALALASGERPATASIICFDQEAAPPIPSFAWEGVKRPLVQIAPADDLYLPESSVRKGLRVWPGESAPSLADFLAYLHAHDFRRPNGALEKSPAGSERANLRFEILQRAISPTFSKEIDLIDSEMTRFGASLLSETSDSMTLSGEPSDVLVQGFGAAVPEPATLAIWSGIAALAGFGVWRKRIKA